MSGVLCHIASKTIDFSIGKALLTVKAKDLACYVGNTMPTAELVYTGFVNGETVATAFTANTLAAEHAATDTSTAGTYDINVTGDAIAANYMLTKEKGTLTVRAISSRATLTEPNQDMSSGSPNVNIPEGSLPFGVSSSDLRLLIDPLSDEEISAISSIVSENMSSSYMLYYDINLINPANNNAVVEPSGTITITIPYPAGPDSSDTFTILHLVNGTNPEILVGTNIAYGIQFEVSSLSPFIIGYTKKASASSGRHSVSPTQVAEKFWQSVENGISHAKDGDVVKANVSEDITTMPVSVLETLKDREVTLTISWKDEKITIYGKAIKPIESNRIFYQCDALASLYQESRSW